MKDVINIKPHHLVDIITDYGEGRTDWQPHPYGHAVHTIAKRVIAEPDVLLRMDSGADDICAPCKHNINGLCDDTIDTSFRPKAPRSKRENNLIIDRRWYARLGLKDGDTLTARDFVAKVGQVIQKGISDIYAELPPKMVSDRLARLKAGVTKFGSL